MNDERYKNNSAMAIGFDTAGSFAGGLFWHDMVAGHDTWRFALRGHEGVDAGLSFDLFFSAGSSAH